MKKRTLKIIAIILGVVILGGALAFTTGLINVDEDKQDEYFGRKLNEDNHYTVDCLELEDSNDGDGITVNVDEKKGGIKLDGTANVDLPDGVYDGTVVTEQTHPISFLLDSE